MTHPVFATLAILETAAAGGIPQMVFMYGAIFAIFYFVLLRPQQKQKKIHQDMVANLKKGDEIVTNGGVVGEVMFIAPATKAKDGTVVSGMGDRVTIKSGDSRLIVERGRIAQVTTSSSTSTAS
ncbi:MAG: preprotein translocase subunit YajC [Gemmatimonadaceae bacterium]